MMPEEEMLPEEEFIYGAPMNPDENVPLDDMEIHDGDFNETDDGYDGNFNETGGYDEGWMYDECTTQVMHTVNDECLLVCPVPDVEILFALPEEYLNQFKDCMKSCIMELVDQAMHDYYDHHSARIFG